MQLGINIILDWFKSKNWTAFPFQKQVWQFIAEDKSGLIHSSTGTGKTYAAWLGVISSFINQFPKQNNLDTNNFKRQQFEPLTAIWITPLRALAEDTKKQLSYPISELGIPWNIEIRTGDTPTSLRQKQSRRLPSCLITTPESFSLLMSYENSKEKFAKIKYVIIDEWHELISSKRGVMTELILARLKMLNPNLIIWGLSATLGNTDIAMESLLGNKAKEGKLVRGQIPKKVVIESIIPDEMEKFPRAGHLGINMLPKVLKIIAHSKSILIFTNTRSQCEIWYHEILEANPYLAGNIALHHGSIDKEGRIFVENALSTGRIKCVVCTSSLDLGVDFSPVDTVIQIGSIKGIARLLQRAGRSGHSPGRTSKIICVPTNAFELIEIAAVRDAANTGYIEPRFPRKKPLDILSQHLVTIAIGGGFEEEDMLNEIKSTYSYNKINEIEWKWVLDFITHGGDSLNAYPEFKRVMKNVRYFYVEDKIIIRRHRMQIGTITSDSMIRVKYITGGFIGSIEESFIAKLNKGDVFIFAGKILEYIKIKDMSVLVRKAQSEKGTIPQWMGGRMPLSTELATAVRKKVEELKQGIYKEEETQALEPIINVQRNWSYIPATNELLIEIYKEKKHFHYFFYTFEGFPVHEGLASLLAYRISKLQEITFSIAVNDYGFELKTDQELDILFLIYNNILSPENLYEDIVQSINSSELSKRQFREIARVAGLVFQGYPGTPKSEKQLQASSSLFFDVFTKYDPNNFLLKQSLQEVLDNQLEISRIKDILERISKSDIIIKELNYPSPFCFPILVNQLRGRLSSEKLSARVERMLKKLNKAAE